MARRFAIAKPPYAMLLFPLIDYHDTGVFMSNYRRNFVVSGCYFFTVNLLERQRTLLTDHIDLLHASVRRVRRLYPFHIDAWVVLPDHLHWVLTLPPDTDDFPVR
ncbi:MAG: transposase [Methylobacter sp.]|nr:transposase [Methylobacter sp.]